MATLAAPAVSGDDGLYASAWLGGVAAAIGLATGATAFVTTLTAAARGDSENAKSRRTGGSSLELRK